MRGFLILLLSVATFFAALWGFAYLQREHYRKAQGERRDLWVFSIKGSLEKGERSVSLYSSENTDFLLSAIRGMPEVESILFLQTVDLSDVGIAELPSFPNLKSLTFNGERALNDANIETLAQCEKLEVLDLNRTNVTKTGLEVITRLPALRTLMLSSDISRETIEHLRDLRPDLDIKQIDPK